MLGGKHNWTSWVQDKQNFAILENPSSPRLYFFIWFDQHRTGYQFKPKSLSGLFVEEGQVFVNHHFSRGEDYNQDSDPFERGQFDIDYLWDLF